MQALTNIINRIEKIRHGVEDPEAIKCDINSLNTILNGGFSNGNLYIVAGKESAGKASFIISVISGIILRRRTDPFQVGIILLNNSEERWITRILSNISGVLLESILRGKLSQEDRHKIKNVSHLEGFNRIEIAAPGYIHLQDLIDTCSKWVFEKNVRIIFIDYLQLIAIEDMGAKDLKIFTICAAIKKLSVDLDIPVIVTVPIKPRKGLSNLKDLRKIGAIEPFADVIMFLDRLVRNADAENERPREEILLSVQKNNTGVLDKVRLRAVLDVQKIVEFDYN